MCFNALAVRTVLYHDILLVVACDLRPQLQLLQVILLYIDLLLLERVWLSVALVLLEHLHGVINLERDVRWRHEILFRSELRVPLQYVLVLFFRLLPQQVQPREVGYVRLVPLVWRNLL